MTRMISVAIVLLGLAACAEVTSEREGTFVFQGKTYRAVTRQFQTENGGYARRYIFLGAERVSCSATDDADCRAQILFTKFDEFDD